MSRESDGPSDPIGPLAANAVSAHELFRAYCDAGFTESQALELIKTALATAIAIAGGLQQ